MAIRVKYLDYANVFIKASVVEYSKCFDINENSINLELEKQPPYGPIYSLSLIKLKTFKTYIKIKLANNFICLSKSLDRALILFIQKPDNSFYLCDNYWGLNNLIIKSRYPLPLIAKSLD